MLEMDKETPETLWAKIGKPYVLKYGAREYETELTELGIFLLLPAVVGVLMYIGELGWVAYNDTHDRILRYAMCILVHMWLAAVVMLHCRFPAVCNNQDMCNVDWRFGIFVWIFNTCKFQSNFLSNAAAILGMCSLFCDGKKLVAFPVPSFKDLANSTAVCLCWLHGGGPYFVPFNDADMSDIFWLYWPHIIFSVVVVVLSQWPGCMCAVECLLTCSELILDFLRFGGICIFGYCFFLACLFVLDLFGLGATQYINACVAQWLAGSPAFAKIFAGGAHAPAGPQIPTEYNISQITTELAEAKPGALIFTGIVKSHTTIFKHYRLHCTIQGLTPDDFELKGVKPVIEAAGIVYNIHAKRMYCMKELRRLQLLA